MALTHSVRAQEFRAAWADVFHVGMGSQTEVNNMVATLVSGRYNAVIVQVVGYMDNSSSSHGAHWKSNILPWSSRVKTTFDPLAALCTAAHANGIEVHAWLGGSGSAMYRASSSWPPPGNATLAAHPEWFMVPYTNSEDGVVMPLDGSYALDMGSADAQEYIVSIVRELVTNYPIDGINWDDELNGTGYQQGMGYPVFPTTNYTRSGLARYRNNTGFVGTPTNGDSAWSNYRRRFKNELMARCQAEIQSIKTNPRQPLRHTSAALAYSPVPSSCNFIGSSAYNYFCDWALMLSNGWVDAVIPQTYAMSTFNTWATRSATCWQRDRHIFPGIGAYLNTDASIAAMIGYTRSLGLQGNSIYSYAVANNSSPYNGDWWAYAAANVYTNTVSPPTMPWRNPATAVEGIVWGRVKNALTDSYMDDAIVTVVGGPTVRSDGNGYYVATMVPAVAAGTSHLTTASKSGSISQATNALALAGDIARYDFLLNPINLNRPTGLVASALSISQISLSWTDTATNETGYVVSRSVVSGGPYSDIANLGANASAYTNGSLTAATTYYYVVRATNSTASSAYSVQASATTQNPPVLPSITSPPQSHTNVVGQPSGFVVTATGSAPLGYQWRFNGAPIAAATSTQLLLPGVQTNHAGAYSVVVTNAFGAVTNSATLTVIPPFYPAGLRTLWGIAPGDRGYLGVGSLPNERGVAYNPVTRRLILASRSGPAVYVLNGDTGADLWTLNTTGVGGGTYNLLLPGVADDGVVYVGNLTVNGSTLDFKLYRWANDSANTLPTVAYTGNPGGAQRWGDTLDVRGAGTNTQIIAASRAGNVVAIFTTDNGVNFTPQIVTVADAPTGAFGLGAAFGTGDTFWGKATGQNLRQVAFDLDAGTGTTVRNHASNDIPVTVAPVGVSAPLNFAGGIYVGATGNRFDLYRLAPPNLGFAGSTNFLSDNDNTGTGTGAVDFGEDRIYVLGANNGILALQMLPIFPPVITNAPVGAAVKVGTNITFSVGSAGTIPLAYQWQFNATNLAGATSPNLSLTNVGWTDGGAYTVIVTNLAGSAASAPAILTILPASPSHIDSIVMLPDGRVQVTASGDIGNYTVETSTNLADWQPLVSLLNTNGTLVWLDSTTNAPQRFYRARHE